MGQKENQVGLVLHAMDHGLISKIKYYLNIVHEYGVQIAKKVLCATPCFKIFHTNQHYKNILLNLRFPVQVDN